MTTSKKLNAKIYPCTETGNAHLFAELFGKDVQWDEKRQRWLLWDGCRWKVNNDKYLRRLMQRAAGERRKRAFRLRGEDGLTSDGKGQLWYAVKSENRHIIDNSLELAKSEEGILDNGEGWDTDPYLLGVKNGVVDLRTCKLHSTRREHKITKSTRVAYNPAATCPRWLQFLDEVFSGYEDKRAMLCYVQKIAGYALTGNVGEQCFFNLSGSGSNGKSTLLGALSEVWGDYATGIQFRALEYDGRGDIPADLARLDGVRLAIASETREDTRLNESRIKQLTGGDAITARLLYKNPYTFPPTHKLMLAFNHKPQITDCTLAMWRRVRLIEFLKTFDERTNDKDLPRKLKSEAEGILRWAVDGCLLWQREGLPTPDDVLRATAEYEAESSPVVLFLEERTIADPEAKINKGELYDAYQRFCASKEEPPISQKSFGQNLLSRGIRDGRSDQSRYWCRLKLKPEFCHPLSTPEAQSPIRRPIGAAADRMTQ